MLPPLLFRSSHSKSAGINGPKSFLSGSWVAGTSLKNLSEPFEDHIFLRHLDRDDIQATDFISTTDSFLRAFNMATVFVFSGYLDVSIAVFDVAKVICSTRRSHNQRWTVRQESRLAGLQ